MILLDFYISLFCVRSSTSLDELEIELEGDIFPLNELAAISKKDPKRFVKKVLFVDDLMMPKSSHFN